jgi:arylformamidase
MPCSPPGPAASSSAPRLASAAALAILAAVASCSGGNLPAPQRVIDLTPAVNADSAMQRLGGRVLELLGTDGRVTTTAVLPKDAAMAFGMQTIHLGSHLGAHLDAASRLLRGGENPAQVPVDKLVGRARIVDLRWHNRHTPVQINDLELTPIEPGDVVILVLGYEPPNTDEWPLYAPLSVQAAEFLVAKQIRALATDLPTLARYDDLDARLRKRQAPEIVWAEYLPFFQAHIPVIGGLVNLDAITKEHNVVFVGLPLPLSQATGAPVRAVALVY